MDFDKISYALGLSMGHNFQASGIKEINIGDFADGVAAVYQGAKPKMTFAEAKEVINRFFTQMQQQQEAEAAKMAETNAAAGREFLEKNGKRAEVKTTPTGLQYEVIKDGNGVHPAATDSVTVHYTGRLLDGTVFDSSVERGEPATFGVSQVIPGWVEALQLMSEGAKWTLFIPSNLAYGERGVPGIAPNQTLIFEVELIKVNK